MRLPARVGLAVVALGHLALVSGQCANEPITFEEIDCSYNADPAWPAVTTSVAAPERTPDSGGSGNLWYRFTNNLDVPAKILLNTADGAAGGTYNNEAELLALWRSDGSCNLNDVETNADYYDDDEYSDQANWARCDFASSSMGQARYGGYGELALVAPGDQVWIKMFVADVSGDRRLNLCCDTRSSGNQPTPPTIEKCDFTFTKLFSDGVCIAESFPSPTPTPTPEPEPEALCERWWWCWLIVLCYVKIAYMLCWLVNPLGFCRPGQWEDGLWWMPKDKEAFFEDVWTRLAGDTAGHDHHYLITSGERKPGPILIAHEAWQNSQRRTLLAEATGADVAFTAAVVVAVVAAATVAAVVVLRRGAAKQQQQRAEVPADAAA